MNYNESIAKLISIEGVSQEELQQLLTVPKDLSLGDVCLPCFRFAKALHLSPAVIAENLAAKISASLPDFLSGCVAVNGYLNFKLNRTDLAADVLKKCIESGDDYGASTEGNGKTVCVDYSSVNIAKPFHIGHLSSTVIGGALYRIFNKLGYKTVGINHLGDWGTQFGKMIVAYKLWGNKANVESGGVKALHKLYVRFHKEAEQNPSLDDDGRRWFRKIEEGDEEALELFRWFKSITLKEVGKVYDRLGIAFDSYAGESFYNDKMQPVLDKLEAKNLLTTSEGAKVVMLPGDLPPCLLVRSDGATLYATRDLAAAYYRKQTYDFYKVFYVVAYQQNLHFQQVFGVLKLLGEPWAEDLEHINFGMVSLEDGAMSSRQGNVVYLEDVLNKSVQKALEIITQKSPDLASKEEIAEQVGVGAVMFSALINNRIKDITFSYDRVLNFDGETCPYVQYTHARCCSILEKGGSFDLEKADFAALDNAHELISAIAAFSDTVHLAAEKREPSFVTRYVVDVCELFNKYYIDNRIIDAPDAIKHARLALTAATRQVIKCSLDLLGIKAPQKM